MTRSVIAAEISSPCSCQKDWSAAASERRRARPVKLPCGIVRQASDVRNRRKCRLPRRARHPGRARAALGRAAASALGDGIPEERLVAAVRAEMAYYRAHSDEGRDADVARRPARALRRACSPMRSAARSAPRRWWTRSASTPIADAAPALARAARARAAARLRLQLGHLARPRCSSAAGSRSRSTGSSPRPRPAPASRTRRSSSAALELAGCERGRGAPRRRHAEEDVDGRARRRDPRAADRPRRRRRHRLAGGGRRACTEGEFRTGPGADRSCSASFGRRLARGSARQPRLADRDRLVPRRLSAGLLRRPHGLAGAIVSCSLQRLVQLLRDLRVALGPDDRQERPRPAGRARSTPGPG